MLNWLRDNFKADDKYAEKNKATIEMVEDFIEAHLDFFPKSDEDMDDVPY